MTKFLGSFAEFYDNLAYFFYLQYLKFLLLEKIFNFQIQIRLSTQFVRYAGLRAILKISSVSSQIFYKITTNFFRTKTDVNTFVQL